MRVRGRGVRRTCAKQVAKMPRESGARTGTKRSVDVLRAGVAERLRDLGDVLVLERLVRAQVDRARRVMRPRARRDAAAGRAGDADDLDGAREQPGLRERQERELDRRREAARRRDVLRGPDRLAVELGQAVDERAVA